MEARAHLLSRRRLLGTAAATAAAGVLTRSPASALADSALPAQVSNVFADSDQLYLTFGTALKDLVTSSAGSELQSLNAVVAMGFVDPAAQIRLALNRSGSAVSFGSGDPQADVKLDMTGDLAHAFASGQLPIEELVLDPELTWSARPADKVRAFVALPKLITPFYLQTLAQTGYAQLLPKPTPPAFPTDRDLYGTLGQAMRETVVSAPEHRDFEQIGKTVSWQFAAPNSEIGLTLTKQPAAVFGAGAVAPDAVIRISGDAAHRLFAGDFGVTEAIGRGYLTYTGDTGALARLITLPAAVRPRYRQLAGLGASNG
jgi:hypothetical protein